MEKELKDKKPAENGTPKVPWTKMIPAAAVIAALANQRKQYRKQRQP